MKAIRAETLARRIRPFFWGRSMSSDKGHPKRDFFSHSLIFIVSPSLLSYFLLEKIFIWWNLLSDGENTLAPTTLVSSACIYKDQFTQTDTWAVAAVKPARYFWVKTLGVFAVFVLQFVDFWRKKKKRANLWNEKVKKGDASWQLCLKGKSINIYQPREVLGDYVLETRENRSENKYGWFTLF